MLEWHFKRLEPDYPDDAALAMKNFRRESTELPELFVRELIQNVMDARIGVDGPAKVIIRIIEPANGLNTEAFIGILSPLEAHLDAAGHKGLRDYTKPTALIVEEFGTKGLTGKVDNSRAQGETERWANFWHGEGKRSKQGKSLGRAGQGKITYHMASAAQALLAYSVREGAPPSGVVFGKCIVQKSHLIGVDYYMRHGYWRREDPSKKLQPLPADDGAFIANFRKHFNLERDNSDLGTSWVIPFPVTSFTKDALVVAILKGFHFSFLRGALEAEICGQKIDKSNVDALISQYIPASVLSPAFVGFLQDVINIDENAIVAAKLDWKFSAGDVLDASAFAEDDLEKLKTTFEAGKVVAVRFPLKLSRLDGNKVDTSFKVYVSRPEDLARTEEIYIRSDLVITDEKWLKDVPGRALGAVVADDDPISEFLGYAEEASHLKWTAAEDDLLARYERTSAKEALSRVRRALPRLCRLLAGHAGGVDEDALSHILSVPDPKNGTKKTLRAGSKHKGAKDGGHGPKEKPKPNPKPFSFSDVAGGMRIKSGDLELVPGQEATVRFAYARVAGEGDPFANYHPFDFDLADTSQIHVSSSKGLTVIGRDQNRLSLKIDDPSFDLTIVGFSPNQRLVCKARTESAE